LRIARDFERIWTQTKDKLTTGEWLKVIELYHKITPQGAEQEKLWRKLEELRRLLLADNEDSKRPDSKTTTSPGGGDR
jgi:hypothetical protein